MTTEKKPKLINGLTIREFIDQQNLEYDAPMSTESAKFTISIDLNTYESCQKLMAEKGPESLNLFAYHAINNQFQHSGLLPFKFPGKKGYNSPSLKATFERGEKIMTLNLVNARKIIEMANKSGETPFNYIRFAMQKWSRVPDGFFMD